MTISYDKIFNSIYPKKSKPFVPQKNKTKNETESKKQISKKEENTIKKTIPKNIANNSVGQSQKATTNVKYNQTVMQSNNANNVEIKKT